MKPELTPDQTQFMSESPFYEEDLTDEDLNSSLSPEEIKKMKQQKILKLIAGGVILVLLILGIIAIKNRSGEKAPEEPEEEVIVVDEAVLDPFNQRLVELKKELDAGDPNQVELPFPPIDIEITLED